MQSYLLMLMLLSVGGLVRCLEKRIYSGYRTYIFAQWNSGCATTYIHAIQEDEWIPGNVLAAVGNALYTVTPGGDPELLAGFIRTAGFRNGVGYVALFNKTSSMLQVDDGKMVIISDNGNQCLRKLDRLTGKVTTFAGCCSKYCGRGLRPNGCAVRRDGPPNVATFCNPQKLRYIKSTNQVYLLDIAVNQTVIRSINLSTSDVSTVFVNLTFEIHDFLIDEKDHNAFIFSISPGILRIDALTGEGTWLAGCDNATYHGKCSPNEGIRQISIPFCHGLLSQDGVYIVSDLMGNQVYAVDPENNAFTKLCSNGFRSSCSTPAPTALALISDYLYIGEAYTYRPKAYYYNCDIRIRRIKFAISSQSFPLSLDDDLDTKPEYVNRRLDFRYFEYNRYISYLIGGLVGGLVGLTCTCIFTIKLVSNRGSLPMRSNAGRAVNRLGADNPTASYRRRWRLLFVSKKREPAEERPLPNAPLNPVNPVQPPPYESGYI